MTYTVDRDRPVNLGLPPLVIAKQRSASLPDPRDRERVHELCPVERVAESRGDQRLYGWFRAALEADDSVTVAGYIEGAASVHAQRGLVF